MRYDLYTYVGLSGGLPPGLQSFLGMHVAALFLVLSCHTLLRRGYHLHYTAAPVGRGGV